ncbi:ATP-binding cassette sub-family C member 4-like [Euwallacea fornicatus]|uniref:ATP-binding cassette sub-family C member 4-like n=1 Tax=Euwallacea fornicatus TaxID=995702 RepID=UPI00338F63E9
MDYGSNKASEEKINPRETAGIFSISTFFYNFALLKQGKNKDIEEDDIYRVIPEYQADALGDKLQACWNQRKKADKNPSIKSCLIRCFGWPYLLYFFLQLFCGTIILVVSPIIVADFVAYFKPGQTTFTKTDAFRYAAIYTCLNLFSTIYTNNLQQLVSEYSIRIRTAVCSLIYRKALRIRSTAFSECSIGKIVTLMSKDVFVIDSGLEHFKDVIIGFLQLAVVFNILYRKVGISAFPAMGFIMVIMPLQMYIGKLTSRCRIRSAKKTDQRFKLLQETLSAIKIIKMYTWQNYFEKLIHKARMKETDKIKMVYYLKACIVILGGTTISFAFYILLISYIARGYSIEAETIYYVQTCLGVVRLSIAQQIPLGITQTADLLASLRRIQWFLDAEEVKDSACKSSENASLYLDRVKVAISGKEVLKSVSLNIDKGLLLITGDVGSGKTALLKTILGEYPLTGGEMVIHGTFSYATEEPWLFPSTIRQNILFGQPFDEQRYQDVLKACALTYDINKFEKLDQTIVGDKGFNLSKGQQARISLARAVYKDSDVYLLDDCLSSLDNHVNKHIFNKCIKLFLKDKICLLVSNNINHIKTMKNNRILFVENGTTFNLEQQRNALDNRITYYIDEDDDNDDDGGDENGDCNFSKKTSNVNTAISNEEGSEEADALLDSNLEPNVENLYHEEKKQGKVLWKNYFRYYRALGGFFVVFYLLAIYMACQFCISYSEKLLSRWVNLEPQITNLTLNNKTEGPEYRRIISQREHFLNLYTLLTIGMVALIIARAFSTLIICMNAAKKLHKALVRGMLSTYMYFFDDHFIGNIINRLSKDFHVTDEQMPYLILDLCRLIFSISSGIILIGSVNWIFYIPAGLLLVKLYFVRRLYLPTGRSLRRLEAATRSPIIGYLNSTLEGLAVVRAAQQQQKLQNEFDRHQDHFTSTFYLNLSTKRFFTFWLDMFGTMFASLVAFKFVILHQEETSGDVGLALVQATMLSSVLQFAIRQITEVENTMTCVERVVEYSDVPSEPIGGQILADWPSKGHILYKNVSLTYKSDGHPVLKDIDLDIKGGSKIGIVGRTGAGKSSIISSLFRLYDFDGEIIIDGENISTLSINFLRENISIIPQDPILFTGTIRTNLDPFDKYSDKEIWSALEKVHMKSIIQDLNQEISDSTSGYSSGQKQLISLARALIQENKIIVLDEATANLDPKTDQLLQETVKESFKNCTVLIIAHRLHSVLSCDKILVLDAGRIVEFNEPRILLQNSSGFLTRMVKEGD